ncbi:MAG: hypothetical protein R3E08_01885 [Thiotrichaceae bacterium]
MTHTRSQNKQWHLFAGIINMGVLCNLKHFPGHGSSDKDSHLV